jgi:hypothetical protein
METTEPVQGPGRLDLQLSPLPRQVEVKSQNIADTKAIAGLLKE